jgi:hypothetical protein
VDVRVEHAHLVSSLGEGYRKVHGYGALAYSAFSAYDGDFVFDLAHSLTENSLLFEHLFP